MIQNRLAVLLAERDLKITRVAKDTGISRNTITSTAQNDSSMIRLETINSLCKYLNITPGEFFEYEPVDISFDTTITDSDFKYTGNGNLRIINISGDVLMDIDGDSKIKKIDMSFTMDKEIEFNINDVPKFLEPVFVMEITLKFDSELEERTFKEDIYEKIKPSFYKSIYGDLKRSIHFSLVDYLKDNVYYFAANAYAVDNEVEDVDVLAKFITDVTGDFSLKINSSVFKPF